LCQLPAVYFVRLFYNIKNRLQPPLAGGGICCHYQTQKKEKILRINEYVKQEGATVKKSSKEQQYA